MDPDETDPEPMSPEETNPEPTDLVEECGFSRRYKEVTGSLDVGDLMLTDIYQRDTDPTTWQMVGSSAEGVLYGIQIHPRGCSGEFEGWWWGDGLLLSVRFEGVMAPEGVEFSKFEFHNPNHMPYDGIMSVPPVPWG